MALAGSSSTTQLSGTDYVGESMSTSTKTKFKFKKIKHTISSGLIPNGYRLATVEEVRNNFGTIKSRGVLEVTKNEWGRVVRLLDGRILADYRPEHTFDKYKRCYWCLVVKEKEWDEKTRVWKKTGSACYPSNGNLLRKELYDRIHLSLEGKKAALALASIHADGEVIYWLLLKNTKELNDLKDVHSRVQYYSTYGRMVECLLTSNLERNVLSGTVLDLLINFISFYASDSSVLCIVFIELLNEFHKAEFHNADIVHIKTEDGMPFLDKASSEAKNDKKWIPILTKLLSLPEHLKEDQVSKIEHLFGDIFIEAVESGYTQLVDDLFKSKDYFEQLTSDLCLKIARGVVRKGYLQYLQDMLNLLKKKVGNELQQDTDGKTLFHYAVESGNGEVFKSLAEAYYKDDYRKKKRDKWGRSFLHWAALNGEVEDCKSCVNVLKLEVDAKDSFGQNSLHFAAKGNKGDLVVDDLVRSFKDLISAVDSETRTTLHFISAVDSKGRTPLHFAAAKGNIKMVKKLLSFGADNCSQVKQYIQQVDGFGRTALHMAAGGGHTQIVQLLLDKGCDNLLQRDVHGSTALHYATQAKDEEVQLAISKSLLKQVEPRSKKIDKSLLLWASAAGIGTAEEREELHPFVKDFLLQEKTSNKTHLLKAAAKSNNVEMTWELLNRGADITDIHDSTWRDTKSYEKQKNVEMVIKEIEIANEQGRDKPSLDDNLGRNVLAEGLAALFLNKFIESPITVSISGEWGMGKSSFMIQTENILLMAASQLSFPNLLPSENFRGAKKMSLSAKGQKIYKKLKNAMSKLLASNETGLYTRMRKAMSKLLGFNETENKLVKLLEKYYSEYHAIYKSLACMDLHNQMLRADAKRESQFQQTREVPRILTIRYNAWRYRSELESWAGLAVTITKEIEQVMTRAQRFSTYWRYSWAKNSVNIYIEIFEIFWPYLLATFLVGWVAWVMWILSKEGKFKDLKYGSIPLTIIPIAWGVLKSFVSVVKSVVSVVKPVSTQMTGYINSPDHRARLGYQEQIIYDINFLKGELGKKPHWFFSFISGEWCWNWLGLLPDNVENTCVPKYSPACEEQLRIITFVDDLDRCDEKVIVQVLSAINLVLAECKINVILGIDKKMIRGAVERHFKDNDDKDLADKFICKIIQIPLSLPDPTDEESDKFLQHYLGHQPPIKTATGVDDSEDTDYGDIDTDDDYEEDNDGSPNQETGGQSITKKVLLWFPCFCRNLYLLTCNLPSKLRRMQDELNEKSVRPLTFSKGARLTREMLLLNYSREEAETLYKLKKFATSSQKLPREWKRFLEYRKFACNILSMIGNVYRLPSWRVELVAWTFICWQWKGEMNTLIKGWHKYARERIKDKKKDGIKLVEDERIKDKNKDKINLGEDEDEVNQHSFGPSLKQIVMNYVIQFKVSQQNSNIEGASVEKSQWLNLLKALHDVQDVSMRGIQLFQQFRLHCETDHLPWPLPDSNDDTYKNLMRKIDPSWTSTQS